MANAMTDRFLESNKQYGKGRWRGAYALPRFADTGPDPCGA
ncbi:MAG: hypothetical protein ABI619_03025 [Betaproteobacteria bacterium]